MAWFNAHITARLAGFFHISLAFGRQFTFAQIIQLLAAIFLFVSGWILLKSVTNDWTENPLDGVLSDKERSEIVRNAAIILFGVVGTAFAFIRLIYMESQRKTAQSSNRFDRYQKAAAMLAENSTSVRQAAVYALTAIANEDKKNFAQMIEKLLAGFIRERSEAPMAGYRASHEGKSDEKYLVVIGQDVKDATYALFQISRFYRFERLREKIPLVDLRDCYFPSVEFHNVNVVGIDFGRAVFEQARFYKSFFENCAFNGANFRAARIDQTEYRDCSFRITSMQQVVAKDCQFYECVFDVVNIVQTKFHDVSRDGAPVNPSDMAPKLS